MKVLKENQEMIAKKIGILALAAAITGGSFCQPVLAAQTMTAVKTEHTVQIHNKLAAAQTQGELPDKDGKPSGVKWELDTATGELSLTGTGEPYLEYGQNIPWENLRSAIKTVKIERTVRPLSMARWFYVCGKLTKITKLPESLQNGSEMFTGCWGLTDMPELPSGLINANGMFSSCRNLTKITKLPRSLQNGSEMFAWCNKLTDMPELPSGLTDTGGMFTGCNLKKTTRIPENIQNGRAMFAYCTNLTDTPKLPSRLTNANGMFMGCKKITSIPELPSGLTEASEMFSGCSNLSKITNLPGSIQNGERMFYACPKLRKLPRRAEIKKGANVTEMFAGVPKEDGSWAEMRIPYGNGSLKNYLSWDDQGERTVKEYCTVEFQDFNGNVLDSVDVNFGGSLQTYPIPEAPKGSFWKLPDLTKVITNILVKAVKEEYTVKFQDWDGKLLEEQKVKYEEAAKEPKVPVRPGYTFAGWDESFDKITRDITVTAVYKKNSEKTDPIPHVPGVKRPKKKLTLTKAVKSGRQIKVRWKMKKGAKGYVVYYSTKKKGKYKRVAAVGKRSNTKVILKSGKKYYFKARPYTKTKKGKKKYKKYIKARKKELNKAVQVTYKNVSGYGKYEIWMKVGKGKYKKVKNFYHGGTLIYTKQKAKTGKGYRFLLKGSIDKKGKNFKVIK
ncbi:leucine-rich repeat protein [Anaerostipes caccae]|uniref:leucine-rich repeat protein n=1 Tax=Anaerostipes caccae TaxID=105841 RepID=UPI0038D3FD37